MTDAQRGLARAVRVMNRLRSPGGCPWDAEQTHGSLAKYLIEEAYEAVDAIGSGDREHLKEELGDVLLQVLFHARIATEHDEDPFGIDDIAETLCEKLERRHPHVFGDTAVSGADEVNANWETIKAAEKQRSGPYDGITWSAPALAVASAVVRRERRTDDELRIDASDTNGQIAADLLTVVRRADALGIDPETALRAALRAATGPAE
ncbi:MAG: MazG family protein [Cumulibacter sp.]